MHASNYRHRFFITKGITSQQEIHAPKNNISWKRLHTDLSCSTAHDNHVSLIAFSHVWNDTLGQWQPTQHIQLQQLPIHLQWRLCPGCSLATSCIVHQDINLKSTKTNMRKRSDKNNKQENKTKKGQAGMTERLSCLQSLYIEWPSPCSPTETFSGLSSSVTSKY